MRGVDRTNGSRSLRDADVEHEAATCIDPVEQPVREPAKLRIPRNVGRRVEACSLFLPPCRVRSCALDLEVQEFALALEEPGAEAADFFRGEHEAGKTEHRAFLVSGVRTVDVGADVPEFVEVGEVGHRRPPETRKPAPERGPRKEGRINLRLA